MRAAAIAGLAALSAAALGFAACSRGASTDAHLDRAKQEAQAAVSDVGKAINASTPDLAAAGRDLKEGADKAGGAIKQASQKARDDLNNKDSD